MLLNRYPAQYRETGSPQMLQLLDLLQSHSPVLNSDLSDLIPWADFESMRLTVAADIGDGRPLEVCSWAVKALLLPPRPSVAELEVMDAAERLGPWQARMVAV